MHGFEGKYIPAGPSGLIMHGRDDVLPTGRNSILLTPESADKSCMEVGQQLSGSWSINTSETSVIQRMWAFTGWQTISCGLTERDGTDNEPAGRRSGSATGGRDSPLSLKVGQAQVDVTVRVPGILRQLPNCLEVIDGQFRL